MQSYYIAPEVLVRSYNEKCDVWSIGVILYILLVGEPPYAGADDFKVMENIAKGEPVKFKSNLWKKVSQQAKNIIIKMLNRDVNLRPSAAEVMEDVWFSEKLLKRKLDANEERNIKYHLKNLQVYKVSPTRRRTSRPARCKKGCWSSSSTSSTTRRTRRKWPGPSRPSTSTRTESSVSRNSRRAWRSTWAWTTIRPWDSPSRSSRRWT
jgi:serine/threonine protein kinase